MVPCSLRAPLCHIASASRGLPNACSGLDFGVHDHEETKGGKADHCPTGLELENGCGTRVAAGNLGKWLPLPLRALSDADLSSLLGQVAE